MTGSPLREREAALLPCPFCGGPATVKPHDNHPGRFTVRCDYRNGCAIGPVAGPFLAGEGAVEAWNARVLPPGEVPRLSGEMVREALECAEYALTHPTSNQVFA